ncbi:macro domain-containing protein [Chitinophaga sancti]|uniref:type II toxin-antitoxin system antitoxin DNA ADP-ribosyl glycohydrolase DarG n=1 Tax=Chitinophaga sancti TaxID=1004 RepID=UPI002A761127|nr:macro domain-containing protein [Chitinophaga sancti]WPQ64584.1 macro domain-containing protein [Chitinophaga sancti]
MEFIVGNLLDSNTQALVNTVNTVGVMGKGIALQFKEAFPHNFKIYVEDCKKGLLKPGKLLVVKENTLHGEKVIINFPTKVEWYQKSKYEYIEEGLKDLVKVIRDYKIESIAIPPLGCGNGGLKWDKVKQIIIQYLSGIEGVSIKIYEPNEEVKKILKKQNPNKEVSLTPAKAMLLYAMFFYETLGENSSLFVANKLAYFLKRLGESSFNKLKFERSHYGPYSVQVAHLLHNMNGKYIKGLEQMDAKAFEVLELQYDKFDELKDYINRELSADQVNRIRSLITLIQGFQSAFSLEVLATVDYILAEYPSIDQNKLVESIHNWSKRKKDLFQERYIQIAHEHLQNYSDTFQLA